MEESSGNPSYNKGIQPFRTKAYLTFIWDPSVNHSHTSITQTYTCSCLVT